MKTRHEKAVDLAYLAGDKIGALFDVIGHTEAPGGRILREYRLARRALETALSDPAQARRVLMDFRANLDDALGSIFDKSTADGMELAELMLAIYELDSPGIDSSSLVSVSETQKAVLAQADAQIHAILGMSISGAADVVTVLGDEQRVGVFSPAPVAREATRWAAWLFNTTHAGWTGAAIGRNYPEYGRQAVAAIDERTTECCLKVNGQIVQMDEMFTLTGTPRYADKMKAPPFHGYCRTAEALVRMKDGEDGLTRSMRDAAQAELAARADGSRKEIHPAHATSRR